ncbi:MAG: hypothetical protein ABIN08_00255 [Caldimonas sp.]
MNEACMAPRGEEDGAPRDWVEWPVPWIDADAPVKEALEIWGPTVPPGWRHLLHATFVRLNAVSGSVKRDVALAAMKVVSGNSRLHFRIEVEDNVIHGIVRKASERSALTCRQCGRAGRLRELGDGRHAVLCPRCAAPHLLRHHVEQMLDSASFLSRLGIDVSESQVPELLRNDFVHAAKNEPALEAGEDAVRMSAACFRDWIRSWREIQPELPVAVLCPQRCS